MALDSHAADGMFTANLACSELDLAISRAGPWSTTIIRHFHFALLMLHGPVHPVDQPVLSAAARVEASL